MAGYTVNTGFVRGMTGHAGSHVVNHLAGDRVAIANGSVAVLACRASGGVYTVTEKDVRRDLVDTYPRDRPLLSGGRRQFLNVGAVGLDGLVTAHAEAFRWETHHLARIGVPVTRVAL